MNWVAALAMKNPDPSQRHYLFHRSPNHTRDDTDKQTNAQINRDRLIIRFPGLPVKCRAAALAFYVGEQVRPEDAAPPSK